MWDNLTLEEGGRTNLEVFVASCEPIMPNAHPHTLNRAHGPFPARFLHLATGDGILALDIQAAIEILEMKGGANLEEAEKAASLVDVKALKDFHAARETYSKLRSCEDWEYCPHGYATVMSLSASGPRQVGPFTLRSPWDPAPDSGWDIVINPGLSFGLGTHATTWLPLQLMLRHLRPGMLCADVGCGSGILSIAMARLGARQVEAVDRDGLAVLEAQDNVRLNNVSTVVYPVHRGSSHDLLVTAQLIAANMGGAPQVIDIAAGVADHLAPDGLFIASGIYGEDDVKAHFTADSVTEALRRYNLFPVERLLDHQCVGIVFRRGA